jgi:predicted RNA-binding protein Jag
MANETEFPHETPPMNDPKRRFFSGDTLQQAVIQAANYFNLDPSYVAYQSLEKRHGFLKSRRKVVIEVDPDNPRRETPAPLPLVPGGRTSPPPPPSSLRSRPPAAAPPVAPSAAPPASAPVEPVAERPPQAPREERDDDRGNRVDRGPQAPQAPQTPREGRDSRGDRSDRGPRRGDRGDRGPRGDRREGGERPRRRREEARLTRPGKEGGDAQPNLPVPVEGGLVTLPETPRRPSDRYSAASGPAAEAAAKAAEILVRIAGLDLVPQVFQGEERLEIDLSGADVDWCFADDGELINAVEHLLPRMIRTLSGETVPVRVDCDNFHEIREERLRSLAQRVAEEVRRKGRPRVLEPMNPADRRIIHVTLADDPGVVTESEGDGYFKRVAIRPA